MVNQLRTGRRRSGRFKEIKPRRSLSLKPRLSLSNAESKPGAKVEAKT